MEWERGGEFASSLVCLPPFILFNVCKLPRKSGFGVPQNSSPCPCHSSPVLAEPDLICISTWTVSPLCSAATIALMWEKILNSTPSFVRLRALMLIVFATESLCDSQCFSSMSRKELCLSLRAWGRRRGPPLGTVGLL